MSNTWWPARESINFDLDVHLQLNITIKKIYTHPVQATCSMYAFMTIGPAFFTTSLVFCGIYSRGSIYPRLQKLYLNISPRGDISIIQLFFSVMDFNQVHTSTTGGNSKNSEFQLSFPESAESVITLYCFHVVGKKFQVHFLKVTKPNLIDLELYDGPDAFFNRLTFVYGSNIKNSTFQFVCLVVVTKGDILHVPNILSYKGQNDNMKPQLSHTYSVTQLNLTSFRTANKFAVKQYLLVTLPGRFIEMTIKFIEQKGAESKDCRYAGIAIYTVANNPVTGHSTFCGTQFDPEKTFQFSKIRPNSSKVLLVYYGYRSGGEVAAVVTLNGSSCEPLVLNACHFKPDIYQHLFISSKPGYIMFPKIEKQCFALQLHCMCEGNRKKKCELFVRSNEYVLPDFVLQYTVEGYLRSFLLCGDFWSENILFMLRERYFAIPQITLRTDRLHSFEIIICRSS